MHDAGVIGFSWNKGTIKGPRSTVHGPAGQTGLCGVRIHWDPRIVLMLAEYVEER